MANTDFSAIEATKKKVWSGKLWKQFQDNNFWMSNGFVGATSSDQNRPVARVTELTETERGTECVMQIVLDMIGDGVAGDNELDGNEEALVNDYQTIKIDQLRMGVKSKGTMAEQASVIRFREEAKAKVSFALADRMDELMFLTGSGRAYSLRTNGAARGVSALTQLAFASDVTAPSTNRIIYAGSATSQETLTSSDKMSWETVVRARTQAANQGVRPIKQNGKDYYVIVMSEFDRRNLILDPMYSSTVAKAAERSSTRNPLFDGSMITVDGVVLYSHRKVFNTTGLASGSKWGAAGTVEGSQSILLGAQALGLALLGDGKWAESDNKDYNNRMGIGYGRKFGMLKPQFKTSASASSREDYGCISIKCAAAAI